jgi:DNA-binding NarL/FixJ family response regulator
MFRQLRPDVTLMDLRMPDMNGIEAITAIRREFPNARIIVLATYAGDAQAYAALRAGASGYLLKSLVSKELLETIRAVHAGKRRVPGEIASEIAEQDCRRAEHLRGDGQDPHEKHPAKARCNRSDPCGDDRPEARNLGPLIRSPSLAG